MSFHMLGYIYKNKTSKFYNLFKAIECYKMGIESNHANAMNYLAYIYSNEEKVKNIEKAIELYNKAIDLGNSTAINSLAYLYANKKEVKNIEKAIELYNKAIDLGNSAAMYNLAYLYENGYGVIKDVGKAILLYQRSAKNGYENAIKKIHQYENGGMNQQYYQNYPRNNN